MVSQYFWALKGLIWVLQTGPNRQAKIRAQKGAGRPVAKMCEPVFQSTAVNTLLACYVWEDLSIISCYEIADTAFACLCMCPLCISMYIYIYIYVCVYR